MAFSIEHFTTTSQPVCYITTSGITRGATLLAACTELCFMAVKLQKLFMEMLLKAFFFLFTPSHCQASLSFMLKCILCCSSMVFPL